uniref:Uncharacterized protein n=1 Tax=viral metagenome TaxID=1070528 RepID=A0A6M3JDJ3_9ZZZZ
MKEVKSVFIQKDVEDKDIYRGIFYKIIKEHPNIIVYHGGPIVEELKDRNVIVTTNYYRDQEEIKDFGCRYVIVCRNDDKDLVIKRIIETARS